MITRFAPSPTGLLHIGGARTALFNYLFAKHHGGEYKLRIEDTDAERNTPEAVAAIFAGLDWLGIPHDGQPVIQSANIERHRKVAYSLLAHRAAYCDYTTQEEMAELKAAWAVDNPKAPFRNLDNEWRDRETNTPFIPGRSFVIRLKAPREGFALLDDLVQGHVVVQNSTLDDMILLRSDGTPTYMLAVVVDDHDMGVTHVIRGDDHLNNTFRQVQIIRAMGWPEPVYAHIPLIHNEAGKKFSKRDGAAGVMEYAEMGILPDAMFNYLLKLGWGHGNDEIISRDRALEWFELSAVGRSPARFDMKKLLNLNAHYLRESNDEDIAKILVDRLGGGLALFLQVAPLVKGRAQTINEMVELARTFVQYDVPVSSPNGSFLDIGQQLTVLSRIDWTHDDIETALRALAVDGIKFRDIMAPLRFAITGSNISPPLIETMLILGKTETLRRLDAVSKIPC